jgi:hypothetical protein
MRGAFRKDSHLFWLSITQLRKKTPDPFSAPLFRDCSFGFRTPHFHFSTDLVHTRHLEYNHAQHSKCTQHWEHIMATASIVLNGVLKSDGTLELNTQPPIPPGPVRITLESLSEPRSETVRLPDPPWLDESVSAPFDLPHFAPAEQVQPRGATERLPEPFQWDELEEE